MTIALRIGVFIRSVARPFVRSVSRSIVRSFDFSVFQSFVCYHLRSTWNIN